MPFSVYSPKDRDKVLDTLLDNDTLFLQVCSIIEKYECDKYDFTIVEMWEDSEIYLQRVMSTKHPEFKTKTILNDIKKEYETKSDENRNASYSLPFISLINLNFTHTNIIYISVIICLYAKIYYHIKSSDVNTCLQKFLDKLRQSLEDSLYLDISFKNRIFEDFDVIESLINKGISENTILKKIDNGKEVDIKEEYKNNIESKKDTPKPKAQTNTSKQPAIEFVSGQGIRTKTKKITAKEIAEVVMEFDFTNGMTKQEMQDMLSRITGLSSSSFQNYLKSKN